MISYTIMIVHQKSENVNRGALFLKITWLGQAGLLFEKNGFSIIIDPYFSNSVENSNPKNYRRVPIDEDFFSVRPDVMIFTHNHLDHFDPETAERFIKKDTAVTVLAPRSVWDAVRRIGGENQYVLFNARTTFTVGGIRFTATYAEHSDPFSIGVVIDDGEKKYYVTGDTLYNESVFESLPADIDVVFLPINGVGNNMNMKDAADFAARVGGVAVPLHCGMFDEIDMHTWRYEKKVIPTVYERIDLP